MISALILGPMLTSFSLGQYFADHKFWVYPLNMTGNVHFQLPGLFLDNPFPDNVNQQLWTIPSELECYIGITALAIVGVAKRPKVLAAVFVAATLVACAAVLFSNADGLSPSGRVCVMSFFAGLTIYVWRDRIRFCGACFLAAVLTSWPIATVHGFEYLATFPIAYATIWLGLQDPKKLFFVAGADYSYGMYLYGFPMQQAVAHLLPQYRFWYVNFVLSVIAAGIAAALSWHLVESRIMKRKSVIVGLVDRQWLSWMSGATAQRVVAPAPTTCDDRSELPPLIEVMP
jgi:peptidoglycan/LPS O-acetylase OafA/YrhL